MSCPHHPDNSDANVANNHGNGGNIDHSITAQEKLNQLWSSVMSGSLSNTSLVWPSFSEVTSEVTTSDYNTIFKSLEDFSEENKRLCANGALCTVKAEWFSDHPYTGLFKRADNGVCRLSSALKSTAGASSYLPTFVGSIAEAKLFPCAALKFFRSNHPSGNLLFGGKKTGQSEDDFFKHALCTNLTEKISVFLSWVITLFRRYSYYPLQLGMSEFSMVTEDGEIESNPVFPWCVALSPTTACPSVPAIPSHPDNGSTTTAEQLQNDGTCSFLDQVLSVPAGTAIYDIYAISSPGVVNSKIAKAPSVTSGIERIGRLVTTSPFVFSEQSKKVFFKHQLKEEDYELCPHWKDDLQSIHGEIGSSYFEKNIQKRNYYNYNVE